MELQEQDRRGHDPGDFWSRPPFLLRHRSTRAQLRNSLGRYVSGDKSPGSFSIRHNRAEARLCRICSPKPDHQQLR